VGGATAFVFSVGIKPPSSVGAPPVVERKGAWPLNSAPPVVCAAAPGGRVAVLRGPASSAWPDREGPTGGTGSAVEVLLRPGSSVGVPAPSGGTRGPEDLGGSVGVQERPSSSVWTGWAQNGSGS